MAMNSDASKHGGSGGELETRVTAVEARLAVIEKTMVTAEVFQREIGALRAEIRDGFGALRVEMSGGIGALRVEMIGAIGGLRAEAHDGLSALRAEAHNGLSAQRAEMHDGLSGLRAKIDAEVGALRVEVAKVPFETVKWLLAVSGIAAAVASTVYNLWFR